MYGKANISQNEKDTGYFAVSPFVVSVTAAAVAANQAQYNQGYRDGCRQGYIDGFREGKADSKKTATVFIKKTVTKNDYDRGYERGYSDCFPRGYAAGLKVKFPK